MTLELILADTPGVAFVLVDGGRSMWVTGKQRKPRACEICGREIPTGERSWRPLNQSVLYRAKRVCAQHWSAA